MIQAYTTGKLGALRHLLSAKRGAGIEKLCEATGWQPHSVRAAISGMRKAGFTVERTAAKGSGTSTYRITNTPVGA